MPRILIADDEPDGRRVLKARLEREGFAVQAVADGDEAFRLAVKDPPDLVLADVVMPVLGGVELCARLKATESTAGVPVILLSGLHKDEITQASSLERGADDYILKPYSQRLLVAKVRAVLRRASRADAPRARLRVAGLSLDAAARTAELKGKRLHLTRKEFDLLALFVRKPGRVLSAAFLLETVWGYDLADYNDPHTVQAHLSTLRRKIGALGGKIVNVPGLGYRFDP